jgi:hypothetical protein
VLPIHRMSSPVYIGIIAMHAAKQIWTAEEKDNMQLKNS